jgi:hypothetical protein
VKSLPETRENLDLEEIASILKIWIDGAKRSVGIVVGAFDRFEAVADDFLLMRIRYENQQQEQKRIHPA